MLNADDQATLVAVRELTRLVRETERPVVLWVGAGASKWLEYPLWSEIALDIRREFSRHVVGFSNEGALALIRAGSFPEFFQRCRDLDRERYFRFLSNAFLPRPETALYSRFVGSLSTIPPLQILTTNVDEALEQRFPSVAVFQRSDITGCVDLLRARRPFIVKLHGSRSAIESTVFATSDYERLKADSGYLNTLRLIFGTATVIFLGYSVTDQYVIDLLSENARDMSLFGAGPHFVVSSSFVGRPPLRRVGYSIKRFPDHRSAMNVLEIIRQVQNRKAETRVQVVSEQQHPPTACLPSIERTAYYISDIMLPGTWNSSVTAQLTPKNGRNPEMTMGLGFTNEEIPVPVSTALHDLFVGLISFDLVYFSLAAVGRVHLLLGAEAFWRAIDIDAIRFVHLQHEPVVMSEQGEIFGDIGLASIAAGPSGIIETPGALIRRQILVAQGREADGEKLLSQLESKVQVFGEAEKMELAAMVRASVMMPEVAELLGVGEAILPAKVPRWLMFPYLRMAHLVHTGAVCDRLGIQAARIPFGGARLASAAFGVQSSSESADQCASYALGGRFDSDLGAAGVEHPAIFASILHFRTTMEGEAFRKEIKDQLLSNAASEFTASINAGLRRNVPNGVLQKAKDKLSSLLTESVKLSPVPAVWTNALHSDSATRLWRAKSRRALLDLARQRDVKGDDPCVCDSGDKLRLCCLAPLRD